MSIIALKKMKLGVRPLMANIVPIAITILRSKGRYLFMKRRNPPYENLWSMVGGKVDAGEHIQKAAMREVMEETGASSVNNFELCGLVSERLVNGEGKLTAHFLIFVGRAKIDEYIENNREGELALFTLDEIQSRKSEFLPSDLHMFENFLGARTFSGIHEAELIYDGEAYTLSYYRESSP
ncbi:MAG: NUDIX hydrolase [Candidatus Thorarchaeota archaeon]|jgi:8-oxo-dGTP diphosphatase